MGAPRVFNSVLPCVIKGSILILFTTEGLCFFSFLNGKVIVCHCYVYFFFYHKPKMPTFTLTSEAAPVLALSSSLLVDPDRSTQCRVEPETHQHGFCP